MWLGNISLRCAWRAGCHDRFELLLCLLEHPESQILRRLGEVLSSRLGVVLSLKGKFEHVPGMFEPRPLSYELCRYSYEDVLHCVELCDKMREQLQQLGALEFVLEVSADRAARSAKPSAIRKVVAAISDSTSLVCLQNTVTHELWLPEYPCSTNSNLDKRVEARASWSVLFGELPKRSASLSTSLAQLSKGSHWAGRLVYAGKVPLATAAANVLQGALSNRHWAALVVQRRFRKVHCLPQLPFPKAEFRVVAVSYEAISQLECVRPHQLTLFQHLCCEHRQRQAICNPSPIIGVSNVVVGRVTKDKRVAVLLHDSSHIYALLGRATSPGEASTDPLSLPQLRMEEGLSELETIECPYFFPT